MFEEKVYTVKKIGKFGRDECRVLQDYRLPHLVLNIRFFSYSRKPDLIYDFAPGSFSISLYSTLGKFSPVFFISVCFRKKPKLKILYMEQICDDPAG
jgi:hypothetical protein